MNIWYLVIIHEGSNDYPSLRMRSSRQHRWILKWRSGVDEYLPVFKAKKKIKRRKDNHLYEIEIREVDKEKKRIRIHYNILAKIEMSRVTMVPYLTSKDFTVSSPSAPQLHYSKFRIDISVRFSIHSTTLPVIFLLPCSHVYIPFAGPKSFWRRLEYGC